MTTIKDIAERAGVSTATVSNVIHGNTKKVSPATIELIENLIKEMGYVQKMGLSVLNNSSSKMVAVVIHTHKKYEDAVISDPFYDHRLYRRKAASAGLLYAALLHR